jgi:hypothetical protein
MRFQAIRRDSTRALFHKCTSPKFFVVYHRAKKCLFQARAPSVSSKSGRIKPIGSLGGRRARWNFCDRLSGDLVYIQIFVGVCRVSATPLHRARPDSSARRSYDSWRYNRIAPLSGPCHLLAPAWLPTVRRTVRIIAAYHVNVRTLLRCQSTQPFELQVISLAKHPYEPTK